MWASVNNYASEPPRNLLPPFQAVEPQRSQCGTIAHLGGFGAMSSVMVLKGQHFPQKRTQESQTAARCGRIPSTATIFHRSTTNSIKFPVSG